MQIEIFTVCEYAFEAAGKLSIVQAYNDLVAPGVPAVHESLYVVIRMRFDGSELAGLAMEIRIADEDGQSIAAITAQRGAIVNG